MAIALEEFSAAGLDQRTPQLTRLGDLLGQLRTEAEVAHRARVEQRPRGPVTGLRSLDQELNGALAVGTHVITAGPGVGKTALALQASTTCGCPSLFVTCEMAPLELFLRVIARTTGQFLGRLKSGEYSPDRIVALGQQAAAAAPLFALADGRDAYASPTWLCTAGAAIRGDAEHLLLVVDSLHSWADSAPGEIDEYTRLKTTMATLRQLAGQLNAAVLVIAERNRGSMKAGGISAGAGSRKIEYGAETVLSLDRDGEGGSAAGPIDLTCTIEKNRSGSPGAKLRLRFHGALQQFEAV